MGGEFGCQGGMVGKEGSFRRCVRGEVGCAEVAEDRGDGYEGAAGCGVEEERP